MMLLFKMAIRNVLRQRRRTVLTTLSMAVGYALLSISLSIGDGSYNLIIEQFTNNITGHVQIHHPGYLERPSLNALIRQPESIMGEITRLFPKAKVASRIKGGGLAYSSKRVIPVPIIGVDPEMENVVTKLKQKVKQGSYFSKIPQGMEAALVGHKIATTLKLTVGSELILISGGADGSIANDIFYISGIVGDADSFSGNQVFLSLQSARRFFSIRSAVHELIINLNDFKNSRQAAHTLTQQGKFPEGLDISPWQDVEKEFYRSMEADKQGNNVSIAIIVIMVGIGVLNAILMSILERMREYGLLRAIGVRPSNIMVLVLAESTVLSVMGCVLGFILALPVNYWFQVKGIVLQHPIEVGGMLFDRIIGEISNNSMLFPGIVIMITAIVVSLFPAIKAASVTPIEVLDNV